MKTHFSPLVPQLQTHLKTSNVYVQRSIIKNNIAILNDSITHPDFPTLIYQHRRDFLKLRDSQISLLASIDKKIKEFEQTSFPFGA